MFSMLFEFLKRWSIILQKNSEILVLLSPLILQMFTLDRDRAWTAHLTKSGEVFIYVVQIDWCDLIPIQKHSNSLF